MRKSRVVRSLAIAILLSGAVPGGASDQAGNTVVAEVDGIKLTFADFESKRAGALFQARNDLYIAERKALEGFIDNYLLERQAQKENLSVAQLLERHVN